MTARSWRHGTPYAYKRKGCRCTPCTEAEAAYARESRARRVAKALPEDIPHGTLRGYHSRGCRCAPCSAANGAYYRDLRARRRQEGRTA